MGWLGLDFDEGPFFTKLSAMARYKEVIEQWLAHEGKAYYCYCTKEELDDTLRAEANGFGRTTYATTGAAGTATEPQPWCRVRSFGS